jgi:hypothetical protein
MIKKYYAAHIKTRLDAAAINVMQPHKFNPEKRKQSSYEIRASPATSDQFAMGVARLEISGQAAGQVGCGTADPANDERVSRYRMRAKRGSGTAPRDMVAFCDMIRSPSYGASENRF